MCGITGFISNNHLNKNSMHIKKMENLCVKLLNESKINYQINGHSRLEGILNITFFDFDGHSLLLNLDMRNIAISFGSACASGTAKASPSLLSIGLKDDIAKNTVRISIGKHIMEQDIYTLVDALKGIIQK